MSNEPQLVLAIDLGTSGPKVGLVESTGKVLGCRTEPTELRLLGDGGAEQDPRDWWRAICAASKRVLADHEASDRVVAVGVTAQWSGTVAVDAEGEVLGKAIIWMDTRGRSKVVDVVSGFPKVSGYGVGRLLRWIRLTGGVPGLSGKDSLAHILYLMHEEPEVYARTATFLEPKDWLNFRLTGERAASHDSIALHWLTDNRDLSRVRYHPTLLGFTGVDAAKLPPLLRSTDIVGEVLPAAAADLGIRPHTKVVCGTPDVHSAAIGSGAVGDFEGHLYVGTSSWLTCHVPFKKTDLARNMASIPSGIPGRYFVANEQETAGACLEFLRDKLLARDDELAPAVPRSQVLEAFDAMASRAPAGSGGLIFLPWLYGERTPVEDHSVRGGFFNLGLEATRDHLVRSVFEGVAYNTKWLHESVERFIGRPFPSLRFIGGGARSEPWGQIMADVLDRPIDVVRDPVSANVRGAGLVAWVGVGETDWDAVGDRVSIERHLEPQAEHRGVYDQLYGEFLEFYRRNQKAYRRLHP